MTLRRLTGLAFLAWEIWWGYVYVSTPRPDEEMATVVAAFLGLFIPGFIILIWALFVIASRLASKSGS
jgi:hypothetical protein